MEPAAGAAGSNLIQLDTDDLVKSSISENRTPSLMDGYWALYEVVIK
jgi:hypothetical protein